MVLKCSESAIEMAIKSCSFDLCIDKTSKNRYYVTKSAAYGTTLEPASANQFSCFLFVNLF